MASASSPRPLEEQQLSAAVWDFVAQHYDASGARQFGIDEIALARLLAAVVNESAVDRREVPEQSFLRSLRLEELVLAHACAGGSDRAWEVFLTRYRATLYETAYKIAREESAARSLAESLYAELYGLDSKGQQRLSKLRYYHGRGSLQGWLRTVIAQEYVNRYRGTTRETSLEAALDEGAQFPAPQPEMFVIDERVEAAVNAELAALCGEERLLLVSYYLDHRTLAEIARLQGVHESTISRKLERATSGLRKRLCKRMVNSGMSRREAEEAMAEIDVRDLRVQVSETLRQGTLASAFYKEKGESQG
jgi:RNA polymerase sigma-70 factor (ECF subfamily)